MGTEPVLPPSLPSSPAFRCSLSWEIHGLLPRVLDGQPARVLDHTAHFLTRPLDSRERGGPVCCDRNGSEGGVKGPEGGGVKGKLIAVDYSVTGSNTIKRITLFRGEYFAGFEEIVIIFPPSVIYILTSVW